MIEDGLVYREWTWRAERWLAATLAGMARSEPAWSKPPLDGETEGLTDQQSEAVTNALTRRISVITGGPGTGKTHLTHALVLMAATREPEDPAARADGPGGAAADRGDRGRPGVDDPQGARVDPGRDPRPRRGLADRGRPRDRRRGVDAVAGDLPAPRRRDRAEDAPGPDRRRRPAAAGRARQAVLRGHRLGPGADGPARARLPAGAALDDRRRRPLDPGRRAAAPRAASGERTRSPRSTTSSATAARPRRPSPRT